VYVPESEREERAQVAATLRRHGGDHLHYYGTHAVMDV
jgi:hypothetical protein